MELIYLDTRSKHSTVDLIMPTMMKTTSLLLLLLCSLLTTTITALSLQTTSSRRSFVAALAGGAAAWGATTTTPAAHALQERNEALCNTGFFTNIWQYKCTPLGDIQDEGFAKDLTNADQGTVDSLMSKLELSGGSGTDGVEAAAAAIVGKEVSKETNGNAK
jgi:hypothetical protein